MVFTGWFDDVVVVFTEPKPARSANGSVGVLALPCRFVLLLLREVGKRLLDDDEEGFKAAADCAGMLREANGSKVLALLLPSPSETLKKYFSVRIKKGSQIISNMQNNFLIYTA